MRSFSNLFILLGSIISRLGIKRLLEWIGDVTHHKKRHNEVPSENGRQTGPSSNGRKVADHRDSESARGPDTNFDTTVSARTARHRSKSKAEIREDESLSQQQLSRQSQQTPQSQLPPQKRVRMQERQTEPRQRQQSAQPVVDEQSRLEFVLEGKDAKGLAIVAVGKACLVFRQTAPDEATGGIVEGAKLKALFHGKQSLNITVTPDDGLAIFGRRSGTAYFEDAVLLKAVSFLVEAIPNYSGNTAIHVELHRAGSTLYEFRLPVQVLPVGAALPDQPSSRIIDLDATDALDAAASVAPPKRRISLKLRFESGLLYVDMEDYVDGEFNHSIEGPATLFDPARLARLVDQVTQSLGSGFYDASAWAVFDGQATNLPGTVRMLSAASERIAEAGSLLYEELAADARLKEILTYIEGAALGTRLTIKTIDAYVPWELLYPFRFSTAFDEDDRKRWPLRTDALWGVRFAIETMQLGEGHYAALQTARRNAEPRVSININPTIRIVGAPNPDLPREVHQQLATSLVTKGHVANVHDTCKDIRGVLQKALGKATLIYVFCHGSASLALASHGSEELLLDADCSLKPRDIDEERPFSCGPVIFLNACQSGHFSPLSFTNFLRNFRKKSSLGLIATTFTVPTAFAARFGAEVVSAYFSVHGKSVADLMLDLRQRHLRNGNPVPLFYAVQCQVELN